MPTRPIYIALLLALTLLIGAGANAAPDSNGEWTLRPGDNPGMVHFTLAISWPGGGDSYSSSDLPESDFDGLDLWGSGRREVQFAIVRDAGRLECDGLMKGKRGSGFFRFVPNPDYAKRMQTLGFDVEERDQFGMTLHDVSIEFAEQMQSAQIRGLDTDSLIPFRVHRVTRAYVDDLRREGQSELDADGLIAFRVHGVSADLIRQLRSTGYEPDSDDLIALRVHNASPEWIEELRARGYERVDLDDLIAFRVHGVSPDFIGEIQALGYPQPDPGDLIAMRIHNVTPKFIRSVQSRGMSDLTIDQLVGMRIRGFK